MVDQALVDKQTFCGTVHQLLKQLEREDVGAFKNFVRVNPNLFTAVLERIEADITKQDTNWRKALEPGLKLAITLRFLATGDSYKTPMYGFRVAHNTICKFIPPVCEAIINAFGEDFMATPDTQEEWREIEAVFRTKWNLPHCLGAIDGKHVALWCPPKSGSEYFNYKGFFSIVLMAVVDGNYKFLNINVGAKGAGSDGGVFAEIDFKKDMDSGLLNLPPAEPLPGGDPTKPVPYFFVGDEAFPLKTWPVGDGGEFTFLACCFRPRDDDLFPLPWAPPGKNWTCFDVLLLFLLLLRLALLE